jgi:branched-chain amino acid transport system substrate-binding protein
LAYFIKEDVKEGMKRVWVIGLFIVLAIAIAAISIGRITGQVTSDNSIVIGGAFSLSGDFAQWGESDMKGAMLAVEEINSEGGIGGKNVKLIVENTESNNVKTVTAVLKLISVDGVKAIIGPTFLDTFGGATPLAEENNVIFITPSASITAIKLEKNYKNVFSTWYRNDKESEALEKYLGENYKKRMVLLYSNDPYLTDFTNFLKQNAPKFGIEIIDEYKFGPDEKDFRTLLLKAKISNPDAIFFGPINEDQTLQMLQQRNEIYPNAPFYAPEYLEIYVSSNKFDGMFENVTIISPKPLQEKFILKYRNMYGVDPLVTASNSYDATKMIIEALKHGNTDAASIKKYLMATEFDTDTYGKVRFDDIGGVNGGEFVVKIVKNGKFVEIK